MGIRYVEVLKMVRMCYLW